MNLSDFSPTVPTVPTAKQKSGIDFFNIVYAELAANILNIGEPSAHRTAALRLLLESKMTLIHGITHPTSSAATAPPPLQR